jgi:hypothetical protein
LFFIIAKVLPNIEIMTNCQVFIFPNLNMYENGNSNNPDWNGNPFVSRFFAGHKRLEWKAGKWLLNMPKVLFQIISIYKILLINGTILV